MRYSYLISVPELDQSWRSRLDALERYAVDMEHLIEFLIHDFSMGDFDYENRTISDENYYEHLAQSQEEMRRYMSPADREQLPLEPHEVAEQACVIRRAVVPYILPHLMAINHDIQRRDRNVDSVWHWDIDSTTMRPDFLVSVETGKVFAPRNIDVKPPEIDWSTTSLDSLKGNPFRGRTFP